MTGQGLRTVIAAFVATTIVAGSASATGLKWERAGRLSRAAIRGLVCPTRSLCFAVGDAGSVFSSTDPTAGARGWTTEPVEPGTPIQAISCPSRSLCVAVDRNGDVLTSTDPRAASSWQSAHVVAPITQPLGYPAGLMGVSCPSAGVCVAVDASGDEVTSADPTGGPSAWNVTHFDGAASYDCKYDEGCSGSPSLMGVSCPSVGICATDDSSGDIAESMDPADAKPVWGFYGGSAMAIGYAAVDCPSTSLCVVVDGDNTAVVTWDPAEGLKAVRSVGPMPTVGLASISCPSTELCFAGGDDGVLLTSTDPTGPVRAWHKTTLVPGAALSLTPTHIGPVACPSPPDCIAVDNHGGMWVGKPVAKRRRRHHHR
jgi:hypothetical protein